jgi:imidazolonepropionase-like amidohydrolase
MRRHVRPIVAGAIALLSTVVIHLDAQTPPPQDVVVIDGGTLIDGNGAAPVRDVQIVIRGNRIAAIGRKGTPPPPGSLVIPGDGKFIIPGLWDSQLNFYSYQGEAMLNTGVTSFIGIGDNGEAGVFMHEGIVKGRIVSPRPWDAPVHFQEFANLVGVESPYAQLHVLKTADEAREWTRRILALGAEIVPFQNGRAADDVVRTAFEEAHKAGKLTLIRSGGPEILPRKAADLGADLLPHSAGVAIEVASDKMPPLPMPVRQQVRPGEIAGPIAGAAPADELEIWSYMDDAKAAAEIKYLVDHHVYLVPTFIEKAMGLPKAWDRFELEDRKLFGNEALQVYYPEERILTLLANYANPVHTRPRNREEHDRGFRNALRFHKMYLAAGGKVLAGTDGGNNATPGPGLHHEMEILADDGGFTAMQVLQGATKWPAEALRVSKDLGTVEAGKLADIVMLNADPLVDIQGTKNIAHVIFNGKVLDGKYHTYYNAMNPFGGSGFAGIPPVENLGFTQVVKRAVFREGRAGGVAPGRLPQPAIETIDTQRHDFADPAMSQVAVREASPSLRLKVTGFNFFDRTQAFFDGHPVPFDLNSITEIDLVIDETYLRRPGRYSIVVKNPPPPANAVWGDGTSNTAWLLVSYKDSLTATAGTR